MSHGLAVCPKKQIERKEKMLVKERVFKILSKLSGKAEINDNDMLLASLGLDSLAMITLLLELEEEFGIELAESDMNPYDLTSAEDVAALAEKYV